MDWLTDIISKLPQEEISDAVSRLTIWWSHFVADVPPDMLPLYAYVGFSVIVLFLWLFIVKVLPSPLGGISWMAVFAVLLAPGTASGDSGDIAPASIGVVYGILMKDTGLALRSLLPVLVVFCVGLLLGFIWQLLKNAIDTNVQKNRRQAAADEKANMQLASANYMDVPNNKAVKKEAVKTQKDGHLTKEKK